jgi:hypothetical protein
MSLEAALAENTAAVKALTAALASGETPIKPSRAKAAAAPAAAPVAAPVVAAAPAPVVAPPTARAATTDTAPPVSAAQIKAAGDDLSTLAELDRATAVATLAEFGVQKMTAMPQSSIPEFHSRVKAAIARLQPAGTPSLI